MNTEREARRDAKEYARAQMFYGEGAGTRRKLIGATVESKADKDPTYARAFRSELERQDMAEHATKARHERERKDKVEYTRKNIKAAYSNPQNFQVAVALIIGAAYVLHHTGLDEKMYNKSRALQEKIKARYRMYKIRKATKNHPVD